MSNCRINDVAFRLGSISLCLRPHTQCSPVHARSKKNVHQNQIVLCPIHLLHGPLRVIDGFGDAPELLQELARELAVNHIVFNNQDPRGLCPVGHDGGGPPKSNGIIVDGVGLWGDQQCAEWRLLSFIIEYVILGTRRWSRCRIQRVLGITVEASSILSAKRFDHEAECGAIARLAMVDRNGCRSRFGQPSRGIRESRGNAERLSVVMRMLLFWHLNHVVLLIFLNYA